MSNKSILKLFATYNKKLIFLLYKNLQIKNPMDKEYAQAVRKEIHMAFKHMFFNV